MSQANGKILVGADSHSVIKVKEGMLSFPTLDRIYESLGEDGVGALFPTKLSFVTHLENLHNDLSKQQVESAFESIYYGITEDASYESEDDEMWEELDAESFAKILYKNLEYLVTLETGEE